MTDVWTTAELPITIIRPARGRVNLRLGEVWRYRELLYFLVWRDIKVRYKQTATGAGWAIVQSVLTMVVLSLLFGRLATRRAIGPERLRQQGIHQVFKLR